MDRHQIIGDVRGVGLAIGVELVRDRVTLEPAGAEVKRLTGLLRDEGVLIGGEGVHGNVLKIRPPVAFRSEHVDILVQALERALGRL
jgi:4-aminobutyrate aminotransferase-like enzyme